MRWLVLITFCLLSCGEVRREPASESPGIKPVTQHSNVPADTAKDAPIRLIVPGERLGKLTLGMDAALLEQVLGPPDLSDAAMGKAWLTWYGKNDKPSERTELNVYTTYQDSTMAQKTVQQIRATSPFFSTAAGIGSGASLASVKAQFPAAEKVAHYEAGNKKVVLYDDPANGIAFEITTVEDQETCTGILIHQKGEKATDVYIYLHPEMTRY